MHQFDRLFSGHTGEPAEAKSSPKVGPEILTVSALTARISGAIELHLPATVCVVGELSNFKRHSSGHLYFTLKDARSEVSCVIWRSDAASLKFEPSAGLEVIATGNVAVFERAGKYQLYTRRLEPRGVGALELAFRQLHEKLAAEGLFEPDLKKPIPRFPEGIGIITSPTGAAVRDIIRTIHRRYPCVEVFVCPVRVQGESAAGEIANAVRLVNRHRDMIGGVDVLIVGRGGGSLEDLWAFNEEVVARAIHASTIPVISGVGHEVDVTIADLVADLRAATPTAAAELAVPVRSEIIDHLARQQLRLHVAVHQRIQSGTARLKSMTTQQVLRNPLAWILKRHQHVDALASRLNGSIWRRCRHAHDSLQRCSRLIARIAPTYTIRRTRFRLDRAFDRLHRCMTHRLVQGQHRITRNWRRIVFKSPTHRIDRSRDRLNAVEQSLARNLLRKLARHVEQIDQIEKRIRASSHETVLGRGFSITRLKKDKSIVRSGDGVRDHDIIVTDTADGHFESRVINRQQKDLFD